MAMIRKFEVISYKFKVDYIATQAVSYLKNKNNNNNISNNYDICMAKDL